MRRTWKYRCLNTVSVKRNPQCPPRAEDQSPDRQSSAQAGDRDVRRDLHGSPILVFSLIWELVAPEK